MVVAKDHNIFEVTLTHISCQRPPQLPVPEGHKFLEVTDDYIICECSLNMIYFGNVILILIYLFIPTFFPSQTQIAHLCLIFQGIDYSAIIINTTFLWQKYTTSVKLKRAYSGVDVT